ncbi:MAG: hypothetical protein LBD30_06945 [Verrucomicrobiales bacterium]|jgi:beta-lactamase superfamily II metal-dependent hydrolase|nr:hypothetical protein [Verrucomicrobiales bacterium]
MNNEIGYEIDFLPVGEGEKSGDAIALHWGNILSNDPTKQTVVVIDGGFADSGEALVEHIKKYYQTSTVNCVISTHPDNDHVSGLSVVLEKMTVNCLVMHRPWLKEHTNGISDLFVHGRVTDKSVRNRLKEGLDAAYQLEQLALNKRIQITEPFTDVGGYSGALRILGPTQDYYESLLPDFRSTPQAKQESSISTLFGRASSAVANAVKKFAENWDIETLDNDGETSAENNSSAITLFHFNDEYILFTGDAGIPALTQAVNLLVGEGFNFAKLKFIQVPHHGSQRNIGPTILNTLIGNRVNQTKIKTAFVSAAKDGEPKHPAKKVTNAFLRRGAPVYATQGKGLLHRSSNIPLRAGWSSASSIQLYTEVEE